MSTEVSAAPRVQIYVPLVNEGTEVFRPTTGVFVNPDMVQVEAPSDYDPNDKQWQFPPGSEVRCVAEFRDGRQVLVARLTGRCAAQSK